MKLYYMPGACSLSPHIVLNEAGLAFDKVKVDGKTKATDAGGDFRSVNPLGYVPLLELDDGTKISEGPAIVQYIADKVPAKNLAPANGTPERTKLQSWLNFISSECTRASRRCSTRRCRTRPRSSSASGSATRFAHLDKHLASNDYLMGKNFSVADAYLFTVSNWAARVDVDLSSFANVLAYRKRIAERPAVQAAMKAEGLLK